MDLGNGGGGVLPVLCRRDFLRSGASVLRARCRNVFRTVFSGIRTPSDSPSSNLWEKFQLKK